ncbi:MAG: MaoC family dehydratase [Reyranellaceae bacterium]
MSAEMHGYYLEDLKVGMSAVFGKTVTEADIMAFAGVSGDTNPVHLHEEFAADTMFKGRVAHGMLSASFISTILGTKLPGPGCIYVSQDIQFKAPVRAGDTVTARAEIIEIVPEKRRVVLKTTCSVGGKVVIDGKAVALVPTRARTAAA